MHKRNHHEIASYGIVFDRAFKFDDFSIQQINL